MRRSAVIKATAGLLTALAVVYACTRESPLSPSVQSIQVSARDSSVLTPRHPLSDAGSCANKSSGNSVDPSAASCIEMLGGTSLAPGGTLTITCNGWGPISGVPNAVFPIAAGHASSWTTTDANVFTVSKNTQDYTATVTGVAPGTASVTCHIDQATQSQQITVTGTLVVTAVTVGKMNTCPSTFYVGQTCQLLASYTDQYGRTGYVHPTTYTWTSSNTAVCTVDANSGLVTAVGVGSCTVTDTADGHAGSITLTVSSDNTVNFTVSGPTQIELTGAYTWGVTPTGYNSIWYYSTNGGSTWAQVGSGNSYTRTLAANDPDFDLKVTGHLPGYSGQTQIHVNLDQPLEVPLTAAINDPAASTLAVSTDTVVNFIVTTSGGSSLSYAWQINYPNLGSTYSPIGGNSSTLTLGVSPSDGTINLRVTVTSPRQQVQTTRQEFITDMSGGGGGCIIC